MATTSLEARVKCLEEINEIRSREIEMQKHEIERLQAARECLNLINKLEHYLEIGRFEDVAELFALKTPGVSAEEFGRDGFEGGEAVWNTWAVGHKSGWRPGFLCVNTTTTDVIEVAMDGKTAKMVFISPGTETSQRGGKWQAYWIWAKLGIDFIKEDGKWKIWHYHVYGLFTCPYEHSWTEMVPGSPMQGPPPGEQPRPESSGGLIRIKPNKPATHPTWWWRPDAYNDPAPEPPETYETFDEKAAY